MANRTDAEINQIISTFTPPALNRYPELAEYAGDALYYDFFGGGGMFLAARMARTLHLQAGQRVLDLGCGKGEASIFLAKHYGVSIDALDLWTPAKFLDEKFTSRGWRQHITPLNLDVRQPLPYPTEAFDAVFCMNSFNFYGAEPGFLPRLLGCLKPGGRLCIGSEALTAEFTPEQLTHPPYVYSFKLPPPNEHIDVFEGDFKKQHSPPWWRAFFEESGLVEVETCFELEDARNLYQELARYEHVHGVDPFDVQILLDQLEWDLSHQPERTLFVITVRKPA